MFSGYKNIVFFSGRTKNPIERFYGLIDKIYTGIWPGFKDNISLGTEFRISFVTASNNV